MDTSLAAVIDLYSFPTGRRLFAHTQVLRRAQAAKHTDLVKHCQAAMAHDRACLDLERRWAGVAGEARRKARPGAAPENDAVRLDALVDRTLTAIRDHAESQAAGAAPDDPIHAEVRAFLGEVFPAGVQAVTTLPFVEELAAVDQVVGQLRSKPMAPAVEDLGLTRLVERLTTLTEQYRAALQSPAAETLAFGKVRAARAEGQERLLETVALILGKHHGRTPEDVTARADLLAPILEQNAAIGAAMKRRRTVEDVDPESGVPDPSAPAGAPEPPEG